MRYDTLLRMADKVMLYKYVVKNVARRAGKTATFMPKPIFEDNGSGMHTHQSIWSGGEPLFYDEAGYAGLSDMARYYIGGLLAHAPSILAFAAPTTNSYRRLVPLYELPPEELANVTLVPNSLEAALGALEKDHDFLLEGDVFTPDVIDTWLEYKRSNELDAVRLRPQDR